MSNKLFDEHMTRNEARYIFYSALDGKSAAEIEQIKAEYLDILPKIQKHEDELISQGWLVD